MHVAARTGRPPGYPERFPVPDAAVEWSVPLPGYAPPYFVAAAVLANDASRNPRGWADPEDLAVVRQRKRFHSHERPVAFDSEGRPRNPRGRTGLGGRGLLGGWGANFAADPMVTRLGPEGLELLVIERRDGGGWALPGGMVDPGEDVSRTLRREFREEAGADLDLGAATEIYRGYVDDPRNTDHAWMETVVKHLHLVPPLAAALQVRAGDDARAVRWAPLTRELLAGLYASHGELVRRALRLALGPGGPPELGTRRESLEALLG